jgi:hypothetical protein
MPERSAAIEVAGERSRHQRSSSIIAGDGVERGEGINDREQQIVAEDNQHRKARQLR